MINWLYNTITWESPDPELDQATERIQNLVLTHILRNRYLVQKAAVHKIQAQYRLYRLNQKLVHFRGKRRDYRKKRYSIPQTEQEYMDKVRLLMKTRSYLYRDIESINRILAQTTSKKTD